MNSYQYVALFLNFSPTSSHLYPLQVENCDSNSRLVVDKDDKGKFRLERVRGYCLLYTDLLFICIRLEHTGHIGINGDVTIDNFQM